MKMQNIQFKNKTHSDRYKILIMKMDKDDVYHKSVAYLIALNDDCYKHVTDIFDISSHRIVPEGLTSAWQTSSSLRVTCLAFNLWSGYCYEETDFDNDSVSRRYSVSEIFYDINAKYFFEAVKLRYPEMFRRETLEERTSQIMID